VNKLWALIAAMAISGLSGWGFLHFDHWPLASAIAFFAGLPGELAYFMISQTNSEDGTAKLLLELLNLVVNTVFYYFVICLIQSRIARRRANG
jgi:hypothetical protein